jgi:hypothetical protein
MLNQSKTKLELNFATRTMILHEFLNVTGLVNHGEGERRDVRKEAPGEEQRTRGRTGESGEAVAEGTNWGEAHEEL